ncbi:MAG: hypothetical protein AB7S75_10120 [Desulfococcaceae bacterium]
MRIILAIMIWIIFAGGLALYMDYRNPAPSNAENTVADSGTAFASVNQKHYILEITPAFAAEPDPFALQTDPRMLPPALLVRMGNTEILRVTEPMEAGIPRRLELINSLTPGENEIWFEAFGRLEEYRTVHALRIRVLENKNTVADQTFWSEPGGNISGVLRFVIAQHPEKESANDPS